MKKMKIAVTSPEKGGTFAWLAISFCVRKSGGHPIRLTPKEDYGKVDFDGLILSGGKDLHPENRKKSPLRERRGKRSFLDRFIEALKFPLELFDHYFGGDSKPDIERDKMEIELFEKALKKNLPVLGICRGHQLINSFFGGSLHLSTRPFYGREPRIRSIFARKKVKIVDETSLLKKLTRADVLRANALHNQSVAEPGKGLKTVAVEKSGIIQATENKKRGLMSVQWHPEYLFYQDEHLKIFRWIVSSARKAS